MAPLKSEMLSEKSPGDNEAHFRIKCTAQLLLLTGTKHEGSRLGNDIAPRKSDPYHNQLFPANITHASLRAKIHNISQAPRLWKSILFLLLHLLQWGIEQSTLPLQFSYLIRDTFITNNVKEKAHLKFNNDFLLQKCRADRWQLNRHVPFVVGQAQRREPHAYALTPWYASPSPLAGTQ